MGRPVGLIWGGKCFNGDATEMGFATNELNEVKKHWVRNGDSVGDKIIPNLLIDFPAAAVMKIFKVIVFF